MSFGPAGLGALALACAVGWFTADPEVGVDLSGGASARIASADGAPVPVERVERAADRLGWDYDRIDQGDAHEIRVAGATAADLGPLVILREARPFAVLHESASGTREVGPARDGSIAFVRVEEPPLFGSDDLLAAGRVDAGSLGSAIRIDLTPEAGDRLARWSSEHIGQRVVLAVGDDVLTAPVLRDTIRGGALIVAVPDLEPEEAEVLADEIAAAGDPLVVTVAEQPSPWPSWLGTPGFRALAVGAGLALAAAAASRRREILALGCSLLASAVGIGWYTWSGGVLTLACWGAAAAGIGAGLAVLRAEGSASRANAVWIGLGALLVCDLLGMSLVHGPARGVALALAPTVLAAATVGALGVLADPRRPERGAGVA